MSESAKKPIYRAYLVVKDSADAPKGTWCPIGAAWKHNDGKGLSLNLDFWYIRQPGKHYSLVLREPLPTDASEGDPEMPEDMEEPEF